MSRNKRVNRRTRWRNITQQARPDTKKKCIVWGKANKRNLEPLTRVGPRKTRKNMRRKVRKRMVRRRRMNGS